MLAKRIIACLDVLNGRVVKGTRFVNLSDQGSPVELAQAYADQGADEVVFLDVSATRENRLALLRTVRKTASVLDIPLTVGGGVRSVADAERLFGNGADKVSINSAAFELPELVTELSDRFGSQSIVVAIDAKRALRGWSVYSRSGTKNASWSAGFWAKEAVRLGAGELLVTSIDRDGTRAGFDLDLLQAVRSSVRVPVIASGGAGSLSDFYDALRYSDAVLAAGVFHTGVLSVGEVKRYLQRRGVVVRT